MRRLVLTTSILCFVAAAAAHGSETTRVSVTSNGSQGDNHSGLGGVDISSNGRFVLFDSTADLDPPSGSGVYLHDRLTGETRAVGTSTGGVNVRDVRSCTLSDDGLFVAFEAFDHSTNHYQILVRDLAHGITVLASLGMNGKPGKGTSSRPSLSSDGRYTAFISDAPDLIPGDTNGAADVFVFDWVTQTLTRASVSTGGTQADSLCETPVMSGGGKLVMFSSRASNLIGNDTNGEPDIFIRNLESQITFRVSTASNGSQANGESSFPSFSADANKIAFQSMATNLSPDDHASWDVFVKDLATGVVERASVNTAGAGGNHHSCLPALTLDGTKVAFASFADNLVADDQNGMCDVFIRDLVQGVTSRVSDATDGTQGDIDSGLYGVAISADGCVVAYQSEATTLVTGDTNGKSDVFTTDLCVAAWRNYGPGWPGTQGVPSLASSGTPDLCTTFTVTLGNCCSAPTVATMFIGLRDLALPTPWDGTLNLLPIFSIPLDLPAGGADLTSTIPCDPALRGQRVFVQATEIDPGASRGIAFTPGLEVILGN